MDRRSILVPALAAGVALAGLTSCSSGGDAAEGPCWITDQTMEEYVYAAVSRTAAGAKRTINLDVTSQADDDTCTYVMTPTGMNDNEYRVSLTPQDDGSGQDFDSIRAKADDEDWDVEEYDGVEMVLTDNGVTVEVDSTTYYATWSSWSDGRLNRFDARRAMPVAEFIIGSEAGKRTDEYLKELDSALEAANEPNGSDGPGGAGADEPESVASAPGDAPAAPAPDTVTEEQSGLGTGNGPFDGLDDVEVEEETPYEEGFDDGKEDGALDGEEGSEADPGSGFAWSFNDPEEKAEYQRGYDEGYAEGYREAAGARESQEGPDSSGSEMPLDECPPGTSAMEC